MLNCRPTTRMMVLDQNSNGDVVVYADVMLFRSYISAALDYAYGGFNTRRRPRNLTDWR